VDGLNNLFPESFVEINPTAAKKLGVADGGKLRISTRRGAVQATAKVTDKLKENVIFMPFHFADGPANALTNPVLDPIAKIPEFKSCAASVEKV
jgi:formate dehydrogenase major subunit